MRSSTVPHILASIPLRGINTPGLKPLAKRETVLSDHTRYRSQGNKYQEPLHQLLWINKTQYFQVQNTFKTIWYRNRNDAKLILRQIVSK